MKARHINEKYFEPIFENLNQVITQDTSRKKLLKSEKILQWGQKKNFSGRLVGKGLSNILKCALVLILSLKIQFWSKNTSKKGKIPLFLGFFCIDFHLAGRENLQDIMKTETSPKFSNNGARPSLN